MKTDKVYSQHEENKEWINKLAFYKDELKVMENRLAEIAGKNTSADAMTGLEHFQNQLIIQKDHIDRINHDLHLDQDKIHAEVNKNPVAVDHRTISDHTAIRENMETFERLFASLKTELYEYLRKWM